MDPHPNQHQLYVIELSSKTNYIILFRVLLVKYKIEFQISNLKFNGDPYRIRTDVNGVRGRCLNHLTNGPCLRRGFPLDGSTIQWDGTPSGTRTLDTLIKSQVLYQLS